MVSFNIVLLTGDPVFEPTGFDQTYAEMAKEVKNSISHRYRALVKLKEFLLARQQRLTKGSA